MSSRLPPEAEAAAWHACADAVLENDDHRRRVAYTPKPQRRKTAKGKLKKYRQAALSKSAKRQSCDGAWLAGQLGKLAGAADRAGYHGEAAGIRTQLSKLGFTSTPFAGKAARVPHPREQDRLAVEDYRAKLAGEMGLVTKAAAPGGVTYDPCEPDSAKREAAWRLACGFDAQQRPARRAGFHLAEAGGSQIGKALDGPVSVRGVQP